MFKDNNTVYLGGNCMTEERACVCPKCGAWYYVNKKNSGPECPDCNCFLICTNVSSEAFDSMSTEEMNSLKQKCSNISKDSDKQQEPIKKVVNDTSIWISMIEIIGTVIVAIAILFGVFVLRSAEKTGIGILGFAVILIIALVAVSGSMVFAGIAKDIKAIRNKLDSK